MFYKFNLINNESQFLYLDKCSKTKTEGTARYSKEVKGKKKEINKNCNKLKVNKWVWVNFTDASVVHSHCRQEWRNEGRRKAFNIWSK